MSTLEPKFSKGLLMRGEREKGKRTEAVLVYSYGVKKSFIKTNHHHIQFSKKINTKLSKSWLPVANHWTNFEWSSLHTKLGVDCLKFRH